MKAKDKLPTDVIAERLDAELKSAREKLTAEKLRRDSFQVCILWRLMQDAPLVRARIRPTWSSCRSCPGPSRRAAPTPNSSRRWNGASR